jgi:O-antigen/teichoic acid export membrane protein
MEENKENLINKELITVTKGAGVSFFGNVFGKGTKFIIIILLTRILGANLFGIYTLGETIVLFFSQFASLGLNQGALKYISAFRGKGDKQRIKGTFLSASFFSFSAGAIFGILLFFYSQQISIFFDTPELSQVLKIFSIALPFLSLSLVFSSSTRAFKTMKYKVIGGIIVRDLVQLLFILLFLFLGYKILGMIWAYVFGLVAGILTLFYFFKKLFPEIIFNKVKAIFENKKLFSTSLPLMYVGILGFLISWTDILMIGYFLPSEQVGIYKVVFRVSSLIIIFSGAFLSIFSPIVSEYYHKNKLKELNEIFKIITKWVSLLSLPIFLIILISPREVLNIFGSSFVIGVVPLLIISLTQLFNAFTFGVGASLAMTSYHNINAKISTFVVVLNIVLNYLFIAILNMGIVGAAIATATSLFFINIFRLFFAKRKLGLNPVSPKTSLIFSLATFSFFLVFFVKDQFFGNLHYFINLVLSSFLVVSIFGISALFFTIEEKDNFIFRKIKSRIKI